MNTFVIYCIEYDNLKYYGSTFNFSDRTDEHLREFSKGVVKKLYDYIRIKNYTFTLDNIKIVYESEKIDSNDDKNIRLKLKKEQSYIDLHDSVNNGLNHINAWNNRTLEQLNYLKQYKMNNQDVFNKRIVCECGTILIERNLTRHKVGVTHKQKMNLKI